MLGGFAMKRNSVRLLSTFLIACLVVVGTPALHVFGESFIPEPPRRYPSFTDIDSDADYAYYVECICDADVMRGTSETLFEPHAALTRAMFVTVLFRANYEVSVRGDDCYDDKKERDPMDYEGKQFSDVGEKAWYKHALNWASELGIVTGYTDGTFRPDEKLTREEFCTILARYYKLKAKILPSADNGSVAYVAHTDYADISSWARESYRLCVSIGLIDVRVAEFDTDGNLVAGTKYYFEPSRTVTRSETAEIVWKMFAPFRDFDCAEFSDAFAKYPTLEYVPYFE